MQIVCASEKLGTHSPTPGFCRLPSGCTNLFPTHHPHYSPDPAVGIFCVLVHLLHSWELCVPSVVGTETVTGH